MSNSTVIIYIDTQFAQLFSYVLIICKSKALYVFIIKQIIKKSSFLYNLFNIDFT
ncbi:hypothetical protein [Anaerobiospirillum thomasii]|uniref:hypothetical protein n=1 Tax=Anaerobiospirillum thomasii TaxID=179995 RepID=UPI0015EB33B5|nr:hypothetical protein [Anaerobiospirillum thomasii]